MKTKLVRGACVAICVAVVCLLAARVDCAEENRETGTYVKVDYPASTTAGELQVAVTYTIWIPNGVEYELFAQAGQPGEG